MPTTKTVIVTGACGGIGKATCSTFKNGGYFVVAVDLFPEPQSDLCYDYYICVDLHKTAEDQSYSREIFSSIRENVPPDSIQVLINNAAIQILGSTDELSSLSMEKSLLVNTVAPFVWSKSFLPDLERHNGHIINISSIHSRLTKKGFVAYSTSKAALSGLTRAMAVDICSGVRINAIEPGAIETSMLKEGFHGNDAAYEKLKKVHPLQRIGRPEDVAQLALALSEDKLGFIHGACIGVNGGISNVLHDPVS